YSTEQENFGAAENGTSIGMYIKGDGSDDFVRLLTVTKGYANNNDPVIGPVVISEIMYNPQDPDSDSDAEFIELTNITGSTVYLYDTGNPTNTWQIKGVSYAFPQGVTLSGNETILITRGNPATFRSTYGISGGIDIYGPYSGSLDNGGEKVTLIRPDAPDPITYEVPEIRIDRVNYSDGSHPLGSDPWPTTPDGGGKSLTRKVPGNYGNDLANWEAAIPTPGEVN
ncbi:MAG: lamin tail domain-containing protein, partial [Planctomycetes bacterium]|nr:lamin tail domain-containing protein [Planctomycetota bacterium]